MKIDNKEVIVLGDIHGDLNAIIYFCKKFDVQNTVFIQVGDFGIGLITAQEKVLKILNDFLNKRGNILLIIRGNHDDPKFFKNPKDEYSNIKLLPDCSVVEINSAKFLFIGGAVSVDRLDEKEGFKSFHKDYFPDEMPEIDYDFIESLRDIKYFITHSRVIGTPPYILSTFALKKIETDPNLLNDINKCDEMLTKAFEILKKNNSLVAHYYGHYHFAQSITVDNVKHTLLDINEFAYVI